MSKTISAAYTSGVTLVTNPTTIASTGTASNTATSGRAVYGPTGTNWTLVNDGLISETASGGIGVSLAQTGTITNAAGGVITAATQGVVLTGGGYVSNASGGTISGTDGISATGTLTVMNAGGIYSTADYADTGAIVLGAGGTVTNASGGRIAGGLYGISAAGVATVVNAGSIGGNTETDVAVVLSAGGLISNQSDGTIIGGQAIVAGGAATVVNAGNIGGSNAAGILLSAGGTVTNQSGGLIGGGYAIQGGTIAVTVVNAGSIAGNTGNGAGILLSAGGLVTNQTGGTITGAGGIKIANVAGTVVNAGNIGGNTGNGNGVILLAGGQVTNQTSGTITGDTGIVAQAIATVMNAGDIVGGGADGISLAAGGVVTNQTGGTITGAKGIVVGTAAGTVVNGGSIGGTSADGISLAAGGVVTNQSGGAISGTDGIVIQTSVGTVLNAGSVGGTDVDGILLAAGGVVTNQSGGAISGTDGIVFQTAAGTVVNFGNIDANESVGGSVAVALGAGGTVTNQSSAMIAGLYGISAAGTATIVNAGGISGNSTFDPGVLLKAGGSVTNQSGGTIDGYSGITIANAAGTVMNDGSIGGDGGNGVGVVLSAGGLVTNQTGGTITGIVDGISAATVATTVENAGSIVGSAGIGVLLSAGGLVTNQTGGAITGGAGIDITNAAGTVVNAGSVSGGDAGGQGAVILAAGGSVTNQSGGVLSGGYGISAGAAATVQNYGSISANTANGTGVLLTAGGLVSNQSGGVIAGFHGIQSDSSATTVVNAGSVGGNTGSGVGVFLGDGGTVTNQSGGTITAYKGIFGTSAASVVVNFGSIGGNTGNGTGVTLVGGGSVTNESTGIITGYRAIVATTTAVTVVNAGVIDAHGANSNGISLAAGGTVIAQAGTITGGADAVRFGTTATARLVIDPGAIFSGTLNGGNTIGATHVSTLELASGASTGTLTGLNTKYVDFAQVTVDSGATWTFINTNSLVHGATLTDAGTLIVAGTMTNAGLILVDPPMTITGKFINTGDISAASTETAAYVASTGSLTNTSAGTIGGGAIGVNVAGGTLVDGGTISGTTDAILFNAVAGNRLILDPGLSLTGTVSGGNTLGATNISTLELASGASAGTLSGLGATIIDFAQVTVDAHATWTLAGSISGFATLTNAGSLANGVTLAGGAGTYAISNLSGGTISGTDAINAYSAVNVVNTGHIVGSIASGVGVALQDGGSLTNQSGGTISGYAGVAGFNNTVAVVNAGVISGSATRSAASGISIATDGSSVTNQSGGTVTGYDGVYFNANSGTVVNAGSIGGNASLSHAQGVHLRKFGSVTNQSGGTITGAIGVYAGSAATVANSGAIIGNATNGDGVTLRAGGYVTNAAGGRISAYRGIVAAAIATVVNAGSIAGGLTASAAGTPTNRPEGVYLGAGGAVTNQSGGVIRGFDGVFGTTAALTVLNAGVITGGTAAYYNTISHQLSFAAGVYLGAGGMVSNQSGGTISGEFGVFAQNTAATVVNAGTIADSAGPTNAGVNLAAGGTVTNMSGALITGYAGVVLEGASSGTVINAGSISATGTSGFDGGVIMLAQTAAVTNLVSGTISGGNGVYGYGTDFVVNAGLISGNTSTGVGVYLYGGGTITNQSGGTISGGADAVKFHAGYTGRVVIDPGAVFIGTVDGGNTIGGTYVSTLELASGASAGTLTGLGTKYINFAQDTIDTGANWIFAGSNTVAAGVSLTNAGTLTDTGTLTNAGTIFGNMLRLSGGGLTNLSSGVISSAYIYGVGAGGADTVVNQGTITGSVLNAIYLAGAGNVTNTTGALISDAYGIKLKGDKATLVNQGRITASGSGASAYTAYLRNGGVIINGTATGSTTSTASIQGHYGIVFKSIDTVNALGTLFNYGTIIGTDSTANAGAGLDQGGTVVNGASGATAALIEGGRDGVYDSTGTVTNYGTIIATNTAAPGYGVSIGLGGTISNLGHGLIEGYVGAAIGTDGTVINDGTIESSQGSIGTAVSFTGGDARLIESPTATLIGGVYGGTGGTAVLELASGTSAGTISGLGTSITNFTSLVFDTGSDWTVSGNDSANGLGTLGITGFTVGDTIDLTGFYAVSDTFSSNSLVLTNAGGTHETLHINSTLTTTNFKVAYDGSGGTDITVIFPPAITAGGTATFTGGGSAVALDSGLSITDTSGSLLVGATISVGSGFTSGDALNFTNTGSISGSFDVSDGVLTLTGTDSVADYQAALESITYSFTPANGDPTGGGGDLSRTIDWIVTDGTNASPQATSTLDVVHAAPTLTTSGTVTFTGGGSAVTLDSTATVTDPDSAGDLNSGTISIAGFVSGDILSANTSGTSITESYNAATGVLTLTGADTLTDYQQVLESIQFSVSPSNTDPTNQGSVLSQTIDWSVNDGSTSNGTDSGTSTLDLVHVAPTITSGGTVTFTGGGSAVQLDSTLSVNDVDSNGTLTGATISIGGFVTGDKLNFTTQNGITGSYNASSGILTLSGTATLVQYQTVLESITYSVTPSDLDPTNGGADLTRTIDWVVSDGSTSNGVSNTGTSTLTELHVAPTIASGGTVTFTGGGSAVTLDSTLTVQDPDSSGNLTGATVSVSGFVSGDLLNFTTQNGITGTYNASSGVLTLSGTATLAQYQTALESITYSVTPSDLDPTNGGADLSRTIDWVVSDGSTSNGVSNTGTSTLTELHVAPTIASGGTVTFTGGGSAVTLDSTLTVQDPDSSGNLTGATISVSGFVGGDLLNFTTQNGITGSYNASSGILSLLGTATLAQYQAALESITYSVTPSDLDPTNSGADLTRTIEWVVSDGSTSNGVSNTGTSTLTEVHVAPTIASGGTVTFTGGGSPVTLDSTLTVQDPDSSGNLTSATISVSGFVTGDLLNFTTQSGITGSYNASSGTLSLSGTATLAQYQAALESITYSVTPSNLDPTNGGGDLSRTIDWVVSDGSTSNGISNTGTSTLTEVHVAPTIAATGTVTYAAGGFATMLDPTATVTDVDSGGVLTGATISIGDGFLNGDLLNFSNQNGITGSYDSTDGVLVLTGTATLANYDTALDSITYSFTPAPPTGDPTEGNTDNFRAISWVVTDGSSSNGTSSIVGSTVHVVKQPPTITDTVAGQATTDEAADDPFSGVTIGDPNTGQTETVSITISNTANGTLSNLDGGAYNNGTYIITGTTVAVTDAIDGLIFTPTAHQVAPGSTVTTGFTITTTDDYGVSTTDSTTTVIATAVNDPASFSGTLANIGVANQGTSTPVSGLTVVDPDVGHTDTVTITLSNPSFGVFTDSAGGTVVVGGYTFTGTPDAVNTALADLVLTPNASSPGVYVNSTTLTAAATGPGGSATSQSEVIAAVTQVLGLASVPVGEIAISVSADGSGFATPTDDDTNEAVVTSPTTGGTYALPTGYQAEFLGGSAAAILTDTSVGNSVLVGNTGADTISASAANDSMVGGNGNNVLLGGPGTIALIAGNGNNVVSAPNGATYVITLGNGADTVYAAGSGTINGGTGSNIFDIEAEAGTNLVNSHGSDVIYAGGTLTNASIAGSGAELMVGASGTVDATVTGAALSVVGGGATTNVTTSGGTGYYYGGTGDLDITDNGTNDTIVGTTGAITVSASTSPFVYGGSNSLLVTGGAGTPTVVGGSGSASITGGSGGVIVAGGSGTPTVSGAATLFGAAGGAMDYVGSTGGLLYYAGDGSETLNADSSSTNNVMIGSVSITGADVITTGTGHDTVAAVAGTMTVNATASPLIYGGSAFLQVNGGTGTPTVIGGSGGASLLGGSGGIVVAAGTGTPTVSGAATMFGAAGGTIDYTGSVGGAIFVAEAGAETINAASSSTSNEFFANNIADSSQVIIGGTATDTVIGGVGATTVEATGSDVVAAGSGSLRFVGGAGSSSVFGGSGTASVSGGSGGVEFFGSSGPATLNGAATAVGAAGGEIDYVGSVGGLTYYAANGTETINASLASTGNLMWAGVSSVSADVMLGGTGNDTMIAGAGASTMTGGGGSDTFIFLNGRDGGTATITDFTTNDVVDLLGYNSSAASAALNSAVSSGGNTTITLTDNTQITFLGVSSASILQGHVFSS